MGDLAKQKCAHSILVCWQRKSLNKRFSAKGPTDYLPTIIQISQMLVYKYIRTANFRTPFIFAHLISVHQTCTALYGTLHIIFGGLHALTS